MGETQAPAPPPPPWLRYWVDGFSIHTIIGNTKFIRESSCAKGFTQSLYETKFKQT